MKVAQIGCGYWGRNVLRAFTAIKGAEMAVCCELDPDARLAAQGIAPGIETCDHYEAILGRSDIEAIVLATPAATHYEQAKAALEAGKHVFVEKPLATNVEQAETLAALAEKLDLRLMAGHTFLYNDAVRWVKDFIDQGELGEIYYAYFQRLNLGRVRNDVDALWNLAPHDVSMALYWFGESPTEVNACGRSYLQPGIDDVAFVDLLFPSGRAAHIHVSWLDPSKTRRAVVVGSKKMIVYDDTLPNQRIVVYDKGIDRKKLNAELGEYQSFTEFQFVQRAGDMFIPRISFREPLQTEAQHFVDCIAEHRSPLSDGRNGVEVVRVLEAAQRAAARAK